jgi:hypothetical protein
MATDYNEEFEVDYFDKAVIDEKTLDAIIEKHLNENDEYGDLTNPDNYDEPDKEVWWTSGSGRIEIVFDMPFEEAVDIVDDCSAGGRDADPYIRRYIKDSRIKFVGFSKETAIAELKEYGAWDIEDLSAMSDDELKMKLLWIACGDLADSDEYSQFSNDDSVATGNDSEDYVEDDLNAIDDGTPDPDDVGDFDEDYTDGDIDMMIADEIRDGKRMGVISNYNYTEESDTDIQWKLTFKGGEATEDDYEEIADAVENGAANGVTSMSGVTWSVEFPGESGIGNDEVKPELLPVTESVDRYSDKPRLDFENDINEYIEEIAQDYVDRFSPDVDYDADEDTIVTMEDAQYEFRKKIEQLKSVAWREVKHQVIAAENLSLDIDRVFEAAFSSKPTLSNSNALGEAVEVKFPLTTEDEVKEAIKNFAKCEVEKQAALAKKIVKAAKKFDIKVAAKVMKALNESVDVSSEDDLIDHINELVDLMKKNNIKSNIITFYKQGIVSTGYNNIDSFYGMAKTINGLNVKRLNNRQLELSIV